MSTIKITSETADTLADFLCEYEDNLKDKLICGGFDSKEQSEILNAASHIRKNLIAMLGTESGTAFTMEIK